MPQKHVFVTLKKRHEFLAVAGLRRKWAAPGLILQVGERNEKRPVTAPRYGLTASKKVGNAVTRNRARRRLRALAQDILALHADPAHDYVLIARAATPARAWEDLRQDLATALKKLGVWRENP
jgi:ribonuclease P protein component